MKNTLTAFLLASLSLVMIQACSNQEPEEIPAPDGAYSNIFNLSVLDSKAVIRLP